MRKRLVEPVLKCTFRLWGVDRGEGRDLRGKSATTGRECYAFKAAALSLVCRTKAASFSDSRLISTLAKAPVRAAVASAIAVVRSDFMLGLVVGFSFSVMSAISAARSATPKGML